MKPFTQKDKEEQELKERILQAQGGKILHTNAQRLQLETILLERPKDMPIAQFKALRRKQTKDIRNALR